jgi:hypothetical protein
MASWRNRGHGSHGSKDIDGVEAHDFGNQGKKGLVVRW